MATHITEKSQLIQYFQNACKPQSQWRIGTEHEKFLFHKQTKTRLGYDTTPGIRQVLCALQNDGNTPIVEEGNIIGLRLNDGGSVTLEPGGQFELSGAPLQTVHETYAEIQSHIADVHKVCAGLGVETVCLGYDPLSSLDDIQWMPKGRYGLMKRYMPTKGGLGLHMMTLSCTVQVNLDYADEADMRKKMQVSNALQPLATALWANSTVVRGKATDYQSFRSHLWTDTDADRCGIPKVVFDADFGFDKWVEYVLDVPMYFVYDNGVYRDALGLSFRDFMRGKLPGFAGRYPTWSDWEDHLTVVFPEVRMKGFIEMRGADTGCLDMLCALPAFWVGLLYDTDILDKVHRAITDFQYTDIVACRTAVPTMGLHAPLGDGVLGDILPQILAFAKQGLQNRRFCDSAGNDESMYLAPLQLIADGGSNKAMLDRQNLGKADMGTQDVLKLGIYMHCDDSPP